MQPINYLPSNQDFGASLLEGLQMGGAIRQMRQQREQQQLEEQYRTDLTGALQSGDPQQLITLSAKYPKQGAGLKSAWEMLGEEQRKSELAAAQQGWYALNSGRPDVALSLLDQQIEGMKNAKKDTSKLQGLRSAIERDPASASQNLGLFIATVAPKEFAETLTKLGGERREQEKQPGVLEAQGLDIQIKRETVPKVAAEARKAEADAESAAVAARFAESNAVKDLEKKGWDIKKIQSDMEIAKENAKIAAMNVRIGQERNAIARQELQMRRDEAVQKRDEAVRTKAADVESARGTMDNLTNTLDRVLKLAVAPDGKPTALARAAMGPVDSRLPTIQQDVADFEALMETIDAQVFMSQVPKFKGLGALSDREGAKLPNSVQNLQNMRQSPDQWVANAREAQRLLQKERKGLALRHGLPDTVPDTPAAPGAAAGGKSADAILRELGVIP